MLSRSPSNEVIPSNFRTFIFKKLLNEGAISLSYPFFDDSSAEFHVD